MADTDINLSVGLDTKDAEKEAIQLQKEIEKIFDSRHGDESAAMTNLELQMKKTYETADSLRQKMQDLRELPPVPTDQYKELDEQLDQLANRYSELERQITLGAAKRKDAKIMEEWAAEADMVGAQMDELMAKRDKLIQSGNAFISPEETEEFRKYEEQLSLVGDKLKQQIIRHSEMTDREVANYERIEAAADRARQAEENRQLRDQERDDRLAAQEIRTGFSTATRSVMGLNMAIRGVGRLIPGVKTTTVTAVASISRGVLRLASLTKDQLTAAVKVLFGAVKKLVLFMLKNPIILALTIALATLIAKLVKIKQMMDKVTEVLSRLANTVLDLLKKTPKQLSNIVKLVFKLGTIVERTVFKSLIVLSKTLIKFFSSIKNLVTENLITIAKWNNGLNDTNVAMSNLTSSLTYLKASLTTAFTPILTVVEPLLTRMADRVAELVTSVGMFIAQVTGQTKFQKAIRYQKDYAESLKETNDQLAAFDKLNVISSKESDETSPEKMGFDLEEVDLEPFELKMSDVFEFVQEKVQAFSDLLTNLPWDKVQKGAEDTATAIAGVVNSITSTDIGASLGVTFGNLVNTLRTFFDKLFDDADGLDFEALGQSFADFFNDAINTIGWKDLGKTLWTGVRKAMSFLRTFLKNNPGKKLGDAFSDFLNGALDKDNFSWSEIKETLNLVAENIADFMNAVITPENFALIGETFGQTLNSVLEAAHTWADKADWDQWGDSILSALDTFFRTFDFELAASTINCMALNLLTQLQKVVDKINWENLGKRIVKFLSDIDWASLGKHALRISQELRKGLQTVWDKVKTSGAFENMMKVFVDLLNDYNEWVNFFKKVKREAFLAATKEWLKENFTMENLLSASGGAAGSSKRTVSKGIASRAVSNYKGTTLEYYNGMGGGYSRDIDTTNTGNTIVSMDDSLSDMEKYLRDILETLTSEQIKNITGIYFTGNLAGLTEAQIRDMYEKLKARGYASGTVIPPNTSEFLAKVGDNKHETEVISPLSTIEQALRNVMAEQNINITFQVEGDSEGIFRIVRKEANRYNKATGNSAFA